MARRVFIAVSPDQLKLLEKSLSYTSANLEDFNEVLERETTEEQVEELVKQLAKWADTSDLVNATITVFNQIPNRKVRLDRAEDTYELCSQLEKAREI